MMMPANYSAIAENEMTYVVGGGLVDCLAPVMEDKNWQNFNSNLIKIVGNSFSQHFVDETLGVIFSGTYRPGNVAEGIWANDVVGVWDKNYTNAPKQNFWTGAKGVLNVALRGVGALASIYTLGSGSIGIGTKKLGDGFIAKI